MDIRVDLEKLKTLTREVRALEVEAKNMRSAYGALLMKLRELHLTIEGLEKHYGFKVDMEPLDVPASERDGDATLPAIRRSPIRSEEDIDQLLELGLAIGEDPELHELTDKKKRTIAELADTPKVSIVACLPEKIQHWTPRERKRRDDDD